MNKIGAVILSVIIVLVLLIVILAAWWNFVGWTSFKYYTGDIVQFAGTSDASGLRFKNCTFTVTRGGDGAVASLDVSSVLNRMANAYKGASSPPRTLDLSGPLSPFSFLIVGFNDKNTTSPDLSIWQGSTVTLVGSMRNI